MAKNTEDKIKTGNDEQNKSGFVRRGLGYVWGHKKEILTVMSSVALSVGAALAVGRSRTT